MLHPIHLNLSKSYSPIEKDRVIRCWRRSLPQRARHVAGPRGLPTTTPGAAAGFRFPSPAICVRPTRLSSQSSGFYLLSTVFYWQFDAASGGFPIFRRAFPSREFPILRRVSFNLTDFGGVGDGVTLNTEAFERAVTAISKLHGKGGGQLNVPPGNWLTAPFNLTSHMTLFLAEGAVILGIDIWDSWELPRGPNKRGRRMQLKEAFHEILVYFQEIFIKSKSRLEWFGIHANQVEDHWNMFKVQKNGMISAPVPTKKRPSACARQGSA